MSTKTDKQVNSYELFIAALSVLSIVNIFFYVLVSNESTLAILQLTDFVLSVFFVTDFFIRFIRTKSKSHYFFNDFGWADLLASVPIPGMKILRLFRLFRAYRIFHTAGLKNVIQNVINERANSAIYLIGFMMILLFEFGSLFILSIELRSAEANITSASDAIWWVYVTITTVGYGDTYPVSNAGRVFGMIVMLFGVGLFGVVTGFLANKFIPDKDSPDEDLAEIKQELKEIKKLLNKSSK